MAAFSCLGMQAANLLTATPGAIALACNTLTGPGPAATIVVKPVATLTSNTVSVMMGAVNAGIVVTNPASNILTSTNQYQGLSYPVSLSAGCAGATSGTVLIRFYASGAPDALVTVNVTVTASASALVASPVTVTCIRSAGAPVSYTPGPGQTVSVTSAAAEGTPFTVDPSTNPVWLAVTPVTGGVAGAAGVPFTVSAVSPCGNYPAGSSNSGSIHLRNLPAPDGLIPVTLQILGPSPLSALPAAPSLSYTKGSGTPASVNVALSASAAATPSFTVDTTSLPPWLTVDAVTGTIPRSLRFTTTSVADSKAQGAYSATVHVQVSGYADLGVPFGLTVSSVAPVLTVAEGTSRNLSWAVGQPLPIPYITLASSGSTIAYSIATSGVLAPVISDSFLKGLVYSYGTPIPVTFDQDVFATAQPGSILSGTVTVTWGSPASTTVITINIAVQSAEATLADVSPLSLPAAAPGQTFTVALSGTGFTASPDARQRTVVGIVSAKSLVADANIASTVVDSAVIILTITVPTAADPLLPFAPAGPGGTVTLGVCNPMGTACSTPTGTAALTIDIKPVIQVVTSASSFVQASPLALATVAPYDMVSLFGFNFCTAGGTGCGKATLFGAVAPATLHYPTSLTPDKSASPRLLTVAFQTQATPPVAIANAPLLFATDGQINLLVPSAVAAFIGKSVDMVVKFGSSSGAPFPVNIAAADPGIFTLSSDGQGEGAVLDSDWSMVTRGNEAGMRQTAADSDIVQMYVTGLGVPDGAADNGSSGTGLWPADCVTTASFLTSLNSLTSGSFTTLDGVFLSRGLLNTGRLLPCLRSAGNVPSVTIGGQPATVTYAGWVPDSVAGLYQLNVRLPGSGAGTFTTASGATIAGPLTVPVQLPVTIAVHGSNSQAGVTMWVAPQLKVTGPVGAALQGTVGAKWSATGSLVTASEGTGPYQYAVTGGSLPGGVTLDAVSGAISGTPAANAAGAYTVTVTATDSAVAPLTGSAAFTLTVNAAH